MTRFRPPPHPSRPAPRRTTRRRWPARGLDLLHKLLTGGAALATLIRMLL